MDFPNGRPTKKSAVITGAIIASLENGSTRKAAAAAAGIDYSTLRRWLDHDEQLRADLDHAEGVAEAMVTRILVGAIKEGDARAAETWLKRRRRETWGDTVDVSGIDGRISALMALLVSGGEGAITADAREAGSIEAADIYLPPGTEPAQVRRDDFELDARSVAAIPDRTITEARS